MTRKQWPLFIVLFIVTAVTIWATLSKRTTREATETPTGVTHPSVTPGEGSKTIPKINGRRVVNLPAGHEKEALKRLRVANSIFPDWKENVVKALKTQGGDSLKKIDIQKVESLIWIQNGLGLNVESLRISVTNEKGESTSFRAMADSQSGKILETWDQPIYDPINSRENFGVKIDPRYFHD